MEQNFKKILQKTKAWNQGVDPVSKSFEGALFKDSAWAFSFDESVSVTNDEPISKPLPKAEAKPVVETKKVTKADALSLVLFVGDTYKEGEDLLGKMIQAMKLKPGEYNRFLFNEALENVEDLTQNLTGPDAATTELLNEIKKTKPQIVVSLGATVTNILLGKREKLSGIHGQFFPKSLNLDGENYNYEVMPLFHPEFLVINPNMKRTAWIDLQKVMEVIGKN